MFHVPRPPNIKFGKSVSHGVGKWLTKQVEMSWAVRLMSSVRSREQKLPPANPSGMKCRMGQRALPAAYRYMEFGEDKNWIKLCALDVEKPPEQPKCSLGSMSKSAEAGVPCVQPL